MCAKKDNPNTWKAVIKAELKASFLFSLFEYAKIYVAKKDIPNVKEQLIAPVAISYVSDSIVPGLHKFNSCLYVNWPFLYI